MINLSNRPKMEEVYPFIEASIKEGGQFVLYPRGTSMNPTIYEGKDCVVLTELKEPKQYDIVLYKRLSGQFVLHRIMKVKNGNYTMCGDNQYIFEKGIKRDQILAVVEEIRKDDGRIFDKNKIYADGKCFHSSFKKKLQKIRHYLRRIIKGEKN